MRLPNFCSGTYQSWSPNASCERCVNLFPEANESAGAKSKAALFGTPGLQVWGTLPHAPVRALWAGEGRLFAVGGNHLYEMNPDGTVMTDIGDVGDDGSHTPCDIWSNGTQLMIVSAGHLYIATGTALKAPHYGDGYGTLDAKATTSPVYWQSGDKFSAAQVGGNITIDGTVFTVDRYVNPTTITVTPTTGDLLNVNYTDPAGRSGVVICNTRYNYAFRVDGDPFLESMAGGPIILFPAGTDPATSGTTYTVWRFIDEDQIIIQEPIGADKIGYEWVVPTGDSGALVGTVATRGTFLDGYFIISIPNSKTFAFSHPWDGLQWSPLDQSVKEGYPDNIAAVFSDHEELWVFGDHYSTEIWRNEGAADAPGGFVRDPGGFIHCGCVAPWSMCSVAQGLHFLGGDTDGRTVAYRAQGFQPVRISTHAVEQIWNTYSAVWDAYAYTYTEQGHFFWVLNFQTANATWVYDATTQLWHERMYGSTGNRHKGRCHAYVWGTHFIGAWDSGIIYKQSMSYYDDAGAPILRTRVAPHVSNEELNIFHHRFQLDCEITSILPNFSLSWSDDDGNSFNTPRTRAPSVLGNRGRVIYSRLGHARDRIYKVTTTSAVKIAITDAYLNPQPTVGVH